MYVYILTEKNPNLWTVGFYNPDGKFIPESDHDDKEEAAKRVAWINGSKVVSYDPDQL
jgi:hypothetical protein